MSFEKVTNYANSFLHRSGEKALCKKTIEEFVERTGRRIDSAYAQLTDSILSDYAIETETGIPDAGSKISEKSANPSTIQHGHKRYNIAADGMQTAFKRLMAFLLESRLMEDKHLIFITDGATEIKEYVVSQRKCLLLHQ